MKKVAERRPVDDLSYTTDVRLKSAPATLGLGMANRMPKEYGNNPKGLVNHAPIMAPGEKGKRK